MDLDQLTPLAAMPHSPDNVDSVSNIGEIKVDQVAIGSCTNSSYMDLMKVAAILKGKKVHPDVSLVISPGSSKIMSKMAQNGALADIINAGARVIENACGPCIGMGQSPKSGAVSLRTFNRNFKGRSGTLDAQVFLVSPETAALSAIKGVLTDGMTSGEELPKIPETDFVPNDNFVVYPEGCNKDNTEVAMGPNIKPFPRNTALPEKVEAKVVLHAGDNITTDHIMPAGAKILPYRSNIPHLSQYCFAVCDETFPERAKAAGESIIVGGNNYGQGSSREHAALVPLYLGVRAVISKSFARIHAANLINAGIVPLTFENPEDYDKLTQGDALALSDIYAGLDSGKLILKDVTTGQEFSLICSFTQRQKAILKAGGLLKYVGQGNL